MRNSRNFRSIENQTGDWIFEIAKGKRREEIYAANIPVHISCAWYHLNGVLSQYAFEANGKRPSAKYWLMSTLFDGTLSSFSGNSTRMSFRVLVIKLSSSE